MAKRILIQAGHLPPLQPGHEDQTGAEGEVELVTAIRNALVRRLRRDARFEPVPMGGLIDESEHVDAALFLHADGVDDPSARGFSVAYPAPAVNRRLANLVAAEIARIPGHPRRRDDNGTDDAAQYYGFSHVDTPGPEVLVEHGFITNPTERRWMLDHVADLARAEHVALCRFFELDPPTPAMRGTLRGAIDGDGADPAPRLTVRSPLAAPPTVPARHAERYLLALPHGGYSAEDVTGIVRQYHRLARDVGIDPVLAIAQMSLETGHLTSFWSQRPRRNLAGIGVTGEPGVGLSFPSIKVAVRAHVGRLLAYALPAGAGTVGQRRLIAEALAHRPLPDRFRGIAPTVAGLAGTWAADLVYAREIARIAREICEA